MLSSKRGTKTLLAVIGACLSAGLCVAVAPGSDWLEPEFSGTRLSTDRLSPSMLKVEADFDGDGDMDRAEIRFHAEDSERAAVFVTIPGAPDASSVERPSSSEMLGEFRRAEGEFMLQLAEPGCYGNAGDVICLAHHGIFRMEIEYGFGTLYWWQDGRWRSVALARGESAPPP